MASSQPPTDELIHGLADWAATASSAAHREAIAIQVADSVIALLAGMASAEGRSMQALMRRIDSSALGCAARLAASLRMSEIDDIHRPTAVTASAIVLPTALAMASLGGASDPARFADALFVGQELSVRLARALGGAGLLAQGLWPSYLVAPFGAAATAGRMLGLSAARMSHALALALAQTPQQIGRTVGTRPGRWLLFGNAVRGGSLAALAAADGVDGDLQLLNHAWLRRIGGDLAHAAWLLPAAGQTPAIEQISIKPHCSAKQALAALHGLRQLLAQGLAPAAIESIVVAVPSAYAAMLDREPPGAGRLASLVSAPGQLALAALQPAALDDVARESLTWSAELAAFAARVQVRADTSLDRFYPDQWPARVSVHGVDGSCREIWVEDSPGDPAQRFGIGEIEDKARRILGAHAATLELVDTGRRAVSDSTALDALCRYFTASGERLIG